MHTELSGRGHRVTEDRPRRSGLRHYHAGSSPTKAESCSLSTDRLFVSCCSPPRLAATQLHSTSRLMRARGADFHRSDDMRSWAHVATGSLPGDLGALSGVTLAFSEPRAWGL